MKNNKPLLIEAANNLPYNHFSQATSEICAVYNYLRDRGEIEEGDCIISDASQSWTAYNCNGPSWAHTSWEESCNGKVKVKFNEISCNFIGILVYGHYEEYSDYRWEAMSSGNGSCISCRVYFKDRAFSVLQRGGYELSNYHVTEIENI